MLKVSIITAVYNAASTVASTIESVIGQTYPNIEYIVVDGMSTDGTDKICNRYSDRIHLMIREKDHGIYDALNKGLSSATGDVIGLLHADDFFASSKVVERIASEFQGDSEIDGVYGDLMYVDARDVEKRLRLWKSTEYRKSRFRWGWMSAHPTVYFRRECYDRFGYFRTDFRLAADYELMLRMMMIHDATMKYIPETLVKMRSGGKSNQSIRNRLLANREDRMAWLVNGLRPPFGLRLTKPLRKLPQYL